MQPVTTHKGKKVKPTHLIHYHGGPIGSMKTAWRGLREEAGFMVPNPAWTPVAPETVPQMIPDLRVNSYSIRHTMGRELRKRRVPAVEISLMLGHLPREEASTSLA